MNSFGDTWTFTSFGESHGLAVGGVLDGVPAGLHIDLALIRSELERRAGKGQSDNVQCTKVIENGHLVIIKNGIRYDALGNRL